MFTFIDKGLKNFCGAGGNLVNYLTGSSQRCLPPITEEILMLPTHVLAERIRRREYSCEQVVRTFINRLRLVQIYLNAIIDERYDDAIKDAQAIDEFLKTTDLSVEQLAEMKPFLGLPFTAKDSIQVAGMKWSSGCVRRKDIISDEDAPVVKNYKKAGAIPIALSNVPELLLWFASSNKLYGTTNNPFDLSRTPGGSSGGEAALMSACGSALSICSDIGGSIRMPAFHCGLFGHKPTHEIINHRGTFPEIRDGLEKIFSFGPLTRYVDDIKPCLKVMAGENYSLLNDIDKPVDLTKLRVFYIDDAGNDMATHIEDYIINSIRQAAFYMESKYGCQVQKAEFKYFKYISMWYMVLFSNNQDVSSLITENTYKINPFYELCKSMVGLSDFSPSALTVAAAQATTMATCSPKIQPHVYNKAKETLEAAQKEFKALLGDDGVFLYVTLPRTAPNHNASLFEFTNVCCPMVMNYLGAPVTQVPTGAHEGLPYGIQVAAAPFNDRLTIAVAKEFESLFGGWIKPCSVRIETMMTSPVNNCADEQLSTSGASNTLTNSDSFEHLAGQNNTSSNDANDDQHPAGKSNERDQVASF